MFTADTSTWQDVREPSALSSGSWRFHGYQVMTELLRRSLTSRGFRTHQQQVTSGTTRPPHDEPADFPASPNTTSFTATNQDVCCHDNSLHCVQLCTLLLFSSAAALNGPSVGCNINIHLMSRLAFNVSSRRGMSVAVEIPPASLSCVWAATSCFWFTVQSSVFLFFSSNN